MLSIDQYAHINKLAQVYANQKILFSIGALLCVWLTQDLAVTLWTFALMSFLIIFIVRIPFRYYFMLLVAPASFCLLGVLSIIISFSTTTIPSEVLWNITFFNIKLFIVYSDLLKGFQLFYTAFGTVICLYFCILTTPMYEINQVLRKVRIPDIIIELMTLIYHYIFLFLDSINKIYIAQQTRLGYQTLKSSFLSLSLLIVALIREIFNRNEWMTLAMKARNIESFLIPSNFYKRKTKSWKLTWIMATYFTITLVLLLI